jgi:hypothetical protein
MLEDAENINENHKKELKIKFCREN